MNCIIQMEVTLSQQDAMTLTSANSFLCSRHFQQQYSCWVGWSQANQDEGKPGMKEKTQVNFIIQTHTNHVLITGFVSNALTLRKLYYCCNLFFKHSGHSTGKT